MSRGKDSGIYRPLGSIRSTSLVLLEFTAAGREILLVKIKKSIVHSHQFFDFLKDTYLTIFVKFVLLKMLKLPVSFSFF